MVTTPDGHSPIISPQKSRTELQVPVGVRSGVWGLLARKGDLGGPGLPRELQCSEPAAADETRAANLPSCGCPEEKL